LLFFFFSAGAASPSAGAAAASGLASPSAGAGASAAGLASAGFSGSSVALCLAYAKIGLLFVYPFSKPSEFITSFASSSSPYSTLSITSLLR